jgi:putative membrane protein
VSSRSHLTLRIAAAGAAVAVVGVAGATPAAASDGHVHVVNTETVQVYTSPTGSVQTRRVYEQLGMTGDGTVDVTNPISTDGLRNLDGFAGFTVHNGEQVTRTTVHGEKHLRSVSNYDGKLPLDVTVSYKLDGRAVSPGDVVGKDGHLVVRFTVRNVTATPQQVSFSDGKGGTVTKTVDVPVPMVGSLSTTTPAGFTNVRSDQANMGGDGKGGTQLSFTMTLFPPIGSDTASFGYSADITDGVIPRAEVSALPVNPMASPTFKSAGDSYKGGADTGAQLADGATKVDTNLLKLRDGAGDLLAGLIKLRDGADQLHTGLADDAAPGADRLASGASQLNGGLGQINSGSKRLAEGTGELLVGVRAFQTGAGRLDAGARKLDAGAHDLHGGTGDALAGGRKLTGGLAQISAGLGSLADNSTGLPSATAGITQLKGGVDQILAGLGDASDANSLIGGLAALSAGAGQLENGAGALHDGLTQLSGSSGLGAAKAGVDQVQQGLAPAVAPGGDLDKLIGGLTSLRDLIPACANDVTCKGTAAALLAGAQQSKTDLTAANAGLLQVSAGLAQAIGAVDTQLAPGADQLRLGAAAAKDGAGKLQTGAEQARAGLLQVRGGLDHLDTGIADAVAGILQLADGSRTAYAGSQDLTTGLGKLNAGAGDLAQGAGRLSGGTSDLKAGAGKLARGVGRLDGGAKKLSDGAGQAADGAGQLSDGANKLANGLGDAANGSGQLVGGLKKAAGGAPKLVHGAQKLSDKGTKKLAAAGVDTAQSYGELYAVIKAGATRAQSNSMAFGAPAGAVGLTAYDYVIQGDDGETSRNLTRGVGGLAVLGAGVGAFALRRRRLGV